MNEINDKKYHYYVSYAYSVDSGDKIIAGNGSLYSYRDDMLDSAEKISDLNEYILNNCVEKSDGVKSNVCIQNIFLMKSNIESNDKAAVEVSYNLSGADNCVSDRISVN